MKRINYLVVAFMLSFGIFFTSCENEDVIHEVENVVENNSAEADSDEMFTVAFVNEDGSPYQGSLDTKVTWPGTSTSYPYKTYVETTWGTFCSNSGDWVRLTGGQAGDKTLTSGKYAITPQEGISKNYTITVAKGYTIKALAGTGGSVSPSSSTVAAGGNAGPFTATANSGYEFSHWTVSGSGGWEPTDNGRTFPGSSSYTVTANFKAKQTVVTKKTIYARCELTYISGSQYGVRVWLSTDGGLDEDVPITGAGTAEVIINGKYVTMTSFNSGQANTTINNSSYTYGQLPQQNCNDKISINRLVLPSTYASQYTVQILNNN